MKKNYIIYGVGAIILLYLIYNMFTSAGKKASKNLSKLSRSNVFTEKFFQYIKTKYGNKWKDKYIYSLINSAKTIHDSKGLFKDNDSEAVAVIRSIQSKAELALISKVMRAMYGEDLPTYINFLDNDHINDVVYILERLPEYAEPTGKAVKSDVANESNVIKVLKYLGV